jgi:hypothetical protein
VKKAAARRVRQGIKAALEKLFPAEAQGFGQKQSRVQAGAFDAAGAEEGSTPGKGFRDGHGFGEGGD